MQAQFENYYSNKLFWKVIIQIFKLLRVTLKLTEVTLSIINCGSEFKIIERFKGDNEVAK